jgi:hypothetical protein
LHCTKRKKKKKATTTTMPSPSSSSFFLQHKKEEEAKQEEEEGDNNLVAVAFFFLFFSCKCCLWTNKQTKETRKKKLDAYLGPALAPAWVPHRLQPLRCSKLLLQALAPSSPAPSSLPLDVSGALAVEWGGGGVGRW